MSYIIQNQINLHPECIKTCFLLKCKVIRIIHRGFLLVVRMGGRGTYLGKIDEVRPQSRRRSYIYRIASLTPRCWRDGRFRLSIPIVSVRVSLPLRSRNRIPVEYTTLYSSISRQPSTPPLLPTRFPRKPHHHRVASTSIFHLFLLQLLLI